MIIYHGTESLAENSSYDHFVAAFAKAAIADSKKPFLLVRPDGARLLIAEHEGQIMLEVAEDSEHYGVSFASTYAEGQIEFAGLFSTCVANAENFIDFSIAINGIRAFFAKSKLRDQFDITGGLPDRSILQFPTKIADPKIIETKVVKKRVSVSEIFRNDMRDVCHFIEELERNDPDENIDFGDAIQVGSFCGGRIDHEADRYQFSHYNPNGEVWSFEINRTIMESIADGSTRQLFVDATVSGDAG